MTHPARLALITLIRLRLSVTHLAVAASICAPVVFLVRHSAKSGTACPGLLRPFRFRRAEERRGRSREPFLLMSGAISFGASPTEG